jgi:hypothetical protein
MFVVVDSAAAGQPAGRIDFGRSLKRGRDTMYALEDSDCRFNLSIQEMNQKQCVRASWMERAFRATMMQTCQPHTRAPHSIRETGTVARPHLSLLVLRICISILSHLGPLELIVQIFSSPLMVIRKKGSPTQSRG